MGKNKRLKMGNGPKKPFKPQLAKQAKKPVLAAKDSKDPKASKAVSTEEPKKPAQHTAPIIPFSPADKILLVGEGDLSFTLALIVHHRCTDITPTVLEKNHGELVEKYPQIEEYIPVIEAAGAEIKYGVDATKMGPWNRGNGSRMEKVGVMQRIIFNFPHVGGKSKDVNRQVRYNQELLVAFFKRALLSLAPGGSIIVTLFEGEPYTLWNIRDLARHSGLQVERSFKFQASAYPGYHHARTLGVVKGKNGEAGAGWKGEERASRSYVLVRKGDVVTPLSSKRKREIDEDDDPDDNPDLFNDV